MRLHWVLGVLVLAIVPIVAKASVTVTAVMDPYLAGLPAGTTASGNPSPTDEDYANGSTVPAGYDGVTDSPLLAQTGINAGDSLTFTGVTGMVNNSGGPPFNTTAQAGDYGPNGPDGDMAMFTTHVDGTQNGFSNANIPYNALVGVFTGNTTNTLLTPSELDFSGAGGTSFTTLSPGLQQIFFIGDGLTGTGTGTVQTFIAPAGATELWLGTWDSYQWWNNTGQFTLTVTDTPNVTVPLPGALAPGLVALLLVAGGVALRNRGRQVC